MSTYLRGFATRTTPQTQPIAGSDQTANNAGGYAWQVDQWTQLRRFLILGAEGGTYYVSERKLTADNAQTVLECIKADGARAVAEIVAVSTSGRAPKNDPAIFALAMAAAHGDEQTRRAALDALPAVCRIGTHLFHFAQYVEQFRGWGRGLRRAVSAWYARDIDEVAYQAVKYRQRDGWTHRDLLRLAHPTPATPAHDALFAWIAGKRKDTVHPHVRAYELAQKAASPADTARLIREYPDIPREALQPEYLTSPDVWDALLSAGMPMTALIRNLATMTRAGLLKPMSDATRLVCEQLADEDRIRKARIHPLAVLAAMTTYAAGHGARSGTEWQPVTQIVDALDSAFYTAFGNVQPTGKRTMLALDVSGSMSFSDIAGMPGITPRVGSAAMALVTAAVEPQHMFVGFTHQLVGLNISPRQRLNDVVRDLSGLPFGGTDCALPMIAAEQNDIPIDTFVVYTDSETYFGHTHPAQALERYRQKTGIAAKLAVVGMVSNGFTIANPDDAGMLDVVGFDTATPNVLSDFATA